MNKVKKLFGILLIVAMLFQTIGVKAESTGETINPNGPAIIPEGYHKLNESDLVSSINHSKITESIKSILGSYTGVEATSVSASTDTNGQLILKIDYNNSTSKTMTYKYVATTNTLTSTFVPNTGGTTTDASILLYYIAEATADANTTQIMEAMNTKYDRKFTETSGYSIVEESTALYRFTVNLTDEFVINKLGLESKLVESSSSDPLNPDGPAITPENAHKIPYTALVETINHTKLADKLNEYYANHGDYSNLKFTASLGENGQTILEITGNKGGTQVNYKYTYVYIATLNSANITIPNRQGYVGIDPTIILYFLAEATADATPEEIMEAFENNFIGPAVENPGFSITEKSTVENVLEFNFTDEFAVNKLKLKSAFAPVEPTDPEPKDPTDPKENIENPETGTFLNISLVALTTVAAAATVTFVLKKRRFFNI